jgi:hypothetical protein
MQGIVIQGPTNYYKKIVPLYKETPNVVWSTWEDEPIENINFIKQYLPVILTPKPNFSGCLNINLQTISTIAGVKYLQEKGITEILKTRGDIIITNLNIFLNLLKGKEIAFLAIAKEGARTDLYYELIYPHYSHDYPVDLVLYGSSENVSNAFDFTIEEYIPIPPEALIAYNFLNNKNIEFKLTYQHFIDNNVYFFLNDCVKNNIELKWIKHNYGNLVEWHNNKTIYDF